VLGRRAVDQPLDAQAMSGRPAPRYATGTAFE